MEDSRSTNSGFGIWGSHHWIEKVGRVGREEGRGLLTKDQEGGRDWFEEAEGGGFLGLSKDRGSMGGDKRRARAIFKHVRSTSFFFFAARDAGKTYQTVY